MRVVVALGGNALLRRGEPLSQEAQERNVARAAAVVAEIARRYEAVITHGNGPQVGLLALEAEAYKEVPPYGLDVIGAESQGMIGFLLEEALRNELPDRAIATVLTSVRVSAGDPALRRPTKPIGPVYDQEQAHRLADERGWAMARDGNSFRRVVPSPEPKQILQIPAIRALLDSGVLTICAGGGGVPMARDAQGKLYGVEGVIDKDLTSALLASSLDAEALLLLTDVDAVYEGWPGADARPLRRATPQTLRTISLDPGSMGPKAEAACRFVDSTGGWAGIGSLEDAMRILSFESGTIVARHWNHA